MNGSADPADITAYYDAWAERYDADLDEWAYRAPRIVAGVVLERIHDVTAVFDAGCGTGMVGSALRAAGYEGVIDGVDLSEASLAVARRSGVYTSLAPANLQEPLAFEDDCFDALTCVGVMTYVPDVEACWREFCRIVRPGGVVAFTQRQDLWEPRQCRAAIETLRNEGVWDPFWISDAQPYLPDNDDFGDQIGVHYVAAIVVG